MNSLSVLTDYELLLGHSDPASLVGEILHVARPPDGTRIRLEVGKLSARKNPGDNDEVRPHWKLDIFLIDQYEYDAEVQVTVAPNLMERHHWQLYGVEVSKEELPPYHPDLPRAVSELLLQDGFCSKPLWVHVHHCKFDSGLEFGELHWES